MITLIHNNYRANDNNIFEEIRSRVSARVAAEYYGLDIGRGGMACCPFHDDKHPSLKLDQRYHCFGCGVGGDAVDYVARLFGLTQLGAAVKINRDLRLHLAIHENSESDKLQALGLTRLRRHDIAQQSRIQKQYEVWHKKTIRELKAAVEAVDIIKASNAPRDQAELQTADAYAVAIRAEMFIAYYLDILCLGNADEWLELFICNRKEVENLVDIIKGLGRCGSAGS